MIILWPLALNSLSFLLFSGFMRLHAPADFRLWPHHPYAPNNDTHIYLVAGNLNWPENAFRCLEPILKWYGDITCVHFNLTGWSAKAAARQILDDIEGRNPRRVIVYTISLGDKVARYLEQIMDHDRELQIIAINPCSDVSFVNPPLDLLLKICTPFFSLLCIALGWLSFLPIIPAPSHRYSLALLADQYLSIAYEDVARQNDRTIGVVMSELPGKTITDGLLRNDKIRKYFSQTHIECIYTNHGDTAGEPDKYLQAVQKILDSHK